MIFHFVEIKLLLRWTKSKTVPSWYSDFTQLELKLIWKAGRVQTLQSDHASSGASGASGAVPNFLKVWLGEYMH
jgi:hypothetical protein